MDKGFYQARLKPGVIGVSVWMMRANSKLPDEIVVKGAESRVVAPVVELPPIEEEAVIVGALPEPPLPPEV